ncbi:hypothetical protein ACFVX6_32790 [Streptomyces sp. NPDC058289]|uniref:hypothetical protein n=1 Tax=Streptomyces sp. NPDC058289 TaxID=3346425 RepID=UPI0036F020AF
MDAGEADVSAEVDQEAGADEVPTAAAVTRGRHRNGSPKASARRSAATPAPIGSRSAARISSGSAASTTVRNHNPGPASAGGTRPEPTADRHAATGTRSRPAAAYSS